VSSSDAGSSPEALAERFAAVRRFTASLAEPLETEDYVVQSMPDASPVKWHLAHTTWFFETFVLERFVPGYRRHREAYATLFNSYYEAVGPRHPRPERGLLTRPTVREVYDYRRVVDDAVAAALLRGSGREKDVVPALLATVELGLHHEQQHQELILTDILHALSRNPLGPAYARRPPIATNAASPVPSRGWLPHEGGVFEVGHAGSGFAFDNEGPRHRVYLDPFSISGARVSAGEFADFVEDGGYRRPELWLSDGFATVRAEAWSAPLYWERRDGAWWSFSHYGWTPLERDAPVSHVSYYEADAFARWAGARLPSEFEWEIVARERPFDGQFVDDAVLVPVVRTRDDEGLFGATWTWTRSPYTEYPGFAPVAGALGEYNGKFMVNQIVLRGGSCLSPRSHLRATYRNFFPPAARWQMSGIRLARAR
jgi:ergothioneine biosynthesis protein EgtB